MPQLTIEMDRKFDDTLKRLRDSSDAESKADVIQKAVALYAYLRDHLPTEDGRQIVRVPQEEGEPVPVLVR